MLAQNFKTATDLGLNDLSHTALTKVLGLLERQEVKWTDKYTPIPNGFNMGAVLQQEECGTVACILGWAMILGSPGNFKSNDPTDKQQDRLDNLFMPRGFMSGTYTVEHAATALRNYLTTGDAQWPKPE